MNIYEDLQKLNIGKVKEKPLLKNYTTYKVGGEAIAVVEPNSSYSLIKLLRYLREKNIKHKVIGNGSNLIFNSSGYNGVIMRLNNLDKLTINQNVITVEAGYNLMKLALKVSKLGLTGMEFATGIPGTIGGAVFMNAGAYKSDMGYIVSSIKVLTPK